MKRRRSKKQHSDDQPETPPAEYLTGGDLDTPDTDTDGIDAPGTGDTTGIAAPGTGDTVAGTDPDAPTGDPSGFAAPETSSDDVDGGAASHGGFGQDDIRHDPDPAPGPDDDVDPLDAPYSDPVAGTAETLHEDEPAPVVTTPEPVETHHCDLPSPPPITTRPAGPIPVPEPVHDEPLTNNDTGEDEDVVLAPDARLAAVLTGTEHNAAAEALNQLLVAERQGADPAELLQTLKTTAASTKWETLRTAITDTRAALDDMADTDLAEHSQAAAERLIEHANTVCDQLAVRALQWRQDVLAAHCAQFEALCEQATTIDDAPSDVDIAAETLATIIPAAALRTATEWAVAAGGDATIGGLVNAYASETPPEAVAALDELRVVPLAALLGHEPATLGGLIDDLVERATNPALLTDRELTATPLEWDELAHRHGINETTAQKTVTQDTKVLADLLATDRFRPLRWALGRLHTDIGILTPVHGDGPSWWRSRLGDQGFEALRWLARYVHEDDWIVSDTAAPRARILQSIDNAAEDWLARTEDLIGLVPGLDPLAGISLLTESATWRDIGDGWLVRWDGALAEKAVHTLELAGHPIVVDDLLAAVGEGTPEELAAELGDELVRIDRHHHIAPAGWGYAPYDAIASWVDRMIDNGGGTASIAEIVAGVARDFGDEAAEQAGIRIHSGPYIVDGDEVSHA